MEKYRNVLIIIVVICFSQIIDAKRYENPFDKDTGFTAIASLQCTKSCANGYLTLQTPANPFLYIHVDSFPPVLTHSAKFKITSTNSNGAGIAFCWQSKDVSGYFLNITPLKTYCLGKYEAGKGSAIRRGLNSYITNGENDLKISKSNNKINIICNGVLMDTVTDNSFSGGHIGLYSDNDVTSAYNSVTSTDTYENPGFITRFTDNFEDNNLDGWTKANSDGTVKCEGGVLKASGTTGQLLFLTSGNYSNASCTTVVVNKQGEPSDLYGLSYIDLSLTNTGISLNTYMFVINGNHEWGISTGGNFTTSQDLNIHSTTDTLIVNYSNGSFKFYVNGRLMTSANSNNTHFEAVGYYVAANKSVEFDNFSASNSSSGIVVNPAIKLNKENYMIGGLGIICDIKGRQVASFTDGEYKNKLRNLGKGPYFIIAKDHKNHIIRRAVINLK